MTIGGLIACLALAESVALLAGAALREENRKRSTTHPDYVKRPWLMGHLMLLVVVLALVAIFAFIFGAVALLQTGVLNERIG